VKRSGSGGEKMMSPKRGEDDAGLDSSDTFNPAGIPLSVNQMMEERRKSRTRPRHSFSALKSSLTETFRNSTGNNSQTSIDGMTGNENGTKRTAASRSLFRRDSASSHGGSEHSCGGSGSDHGGVFSDSQTNRRRDTKTTFRLPSLRVQASTSPSSDIDASHFSRDRGTERDESAYARSIRRYAAGQYVLISNHGLAEGTNCLVNIYGFPEVVGGGALSPEQRRGPYTYLLAQVKSVHFGEDAQYYTVSRCDNEEEQRADAEWMEPITDPIGIEAAKTAAKKKVDDTYLHNRSHTDRLFLRSVTKGTKLVHTGASLLRRKMKEQALKCLSGRRPYKISFKFTGVNFLVLCTIWYLYIDQVRLAFFSHAADFACAVVSW
jgi:hypothetical protein